MQISCLLVPWVTRSNGLDVLAGAGAGAGKSKYAGIHTVAVALVHDCYLNGDAMCWGFGFGVIGEAGHAGVGEIYKTQCCGETSVGTTDHQDAVAARDGSDEVVGRHGGRGLERSEREEREKRKRRRQRAKKSNKTNKIIASYNFRIRRVLILSD